MATPHSNFIIMCCNNRHNKDENKNHPAADDDMRWCKRTSFITSSSPSSCFGYHLFFICIQKEFNQSVHSTAYRIIDFTPHFQIAHISASAGQIDIFLVSMESSCHGTTNTASCVSFALEVLKIQSYKKYHSILRDTLFLLSSRLPITLVGLVPFWSQWIPHSMVQ